MGAMVLAVLNRTEDVERLLDGAAWLLDVHGGGRLKALAVRRPPEAAILPSEEVLTAAREAALRAEQVQWAEGLHRAAAAWAVRAARTGLRFDWLDVEGDAAQCVAAQGRAAEAVVMARPADGDTERVRAGMHAALFDTGTPVLAVPPGWQGTAGRTVAVAWKDDNRAAKAVRAAMPVLRKAGCVHVLCADQPAALPAVLTEHEVAAVPHSVPDGDGPVAERLLRSAHALGADLLVMGVYAHGAWREFLFGGVTRYMLANADLPLLMRH
jgi:nucleotide-binding universal stress UspA family protein